MSDVELCQVGANGVELTAAVTGEGPAVLLLRGFPHTWRLWTEVMDALVERHAESVWS